MEVPSATTHPPPHPQLRRDLAYKNALSRCLWNACANPTTTPAFPQTALLKTVNYAFRPLRGRSAPEFLCFGRFAAEALKNFYVSAASRQKRTNIYVFLSVSAAKRPSNSKINYPNPVPQTGLAITCSRRLRVRVWNSRAQLATHPSLPRPTPQK